MRFRERTTDLTERTADLTEALEQQTATSEVLQVVSNSPSDLQPVFASMLENAVRICDAKFGNIYRWDGDALHLAASHNTPVAFAEHRRRSPLRLNQMPESLHRMLAAREPIQVEDGSANARFNRSAATLGAPSSIACWAASSNRASTHSSPRVVQTPDVPQSARRELDRRAANGRQSDVLHLARRRRATPPGRRGRPGE